MGKKLELTNMVFGKLTVISEAGKTKAGKYRWICKCSCGNTKEIESQHLTNGVTKSCGCYRKEEIIKRLTTHGKTKRGIKKPTEYTIWSNMVDRCRRVNCKAYKNYGGRGIKVCDRWANSFENFLQDMGNRPSFLHSIDRKNNNGDYTPENCKWSLPVEQARNKRNNVWIGYNGQNKTVAEWALELKTFPASIRMMTKYKPFNEVYAFYESKNLRTHV